MSKKRGKKYKQALKDQPTQAVSLKDALKQIGKLSISKFTGNIDIHIALNAVKKDKEGSKAAVRITTTLPHPIGEEQKVIVFCDAADVERAKKAGAVEAGLTDLVNKITQDGWLDFDVAIATPSVMPQIAKLGRVLGSRGLMPNPKSGTIVQPTQLEQVIKEFKSGKLTLKADSTNVIHATVGKIDSKPEEVEANIKALVDEILTVTGKSAHTLIKSVHIAPTMGPSIQIKVSEFSK